MMKKWIVIDRWGRYVEETFEGLEAADVRREECDAIQPQHGPHQVREQDRK